MMKNLLFLISGHPVICCKGTLFSGIIAYCLSLKLLGPFQELHDPCMAKLLQ
jgi:hypothetical protein